jgi:hypothetical protein
MKPDVRLPVSRFSRLCPGRSVSSAAPAWRRCICAGAAAPWPSVTRLTVAQLKAALTETGDPSARRPAVRCSTREGGGLANLVRADNPLLFAQPTGLVRTFAARAPPPGGRTHRRRRRRSDRAASVVPQSGSGSVAVPATVTVPGSLSVTATAGAVPSDVTGFIVLTRHGRAPHPVLLLRIRPEAAAETRTPLRRPGSYHGRRTARLRRSASTAIRRAATSRIRAGTRLPRHDHRPPANFGVVVTAGRVVPTSRSTASRITSSATRACRSTSTRTGRPMACASRPPAPSCWPRVRTTSSRHALEQ